jgi:hypothetical protein
MKNDFFDLYRDKNGNLYKFNTVTDSGGHSESKSSPSMQATALDLDTAYTRFFDGHSEIADMDDAIFVKNLNKWLRRRLNRLEEENERLNSLFLSQKDTIDSLLDEKERLTQKITEMQRTGVFTPKKLVSETGRLQRFSTVDLRE